MSVELAYIRLVKLPISTSVMVCDIYGFHPKTLDDFDPNTAYFVTNESYKNERAGIVFLASKWNVFIVKKNW